MLPAQPPSLRQSSVWLQQLAMMHWLQGVPPGSSEQLPASIGGMPQCPPLQVKPTQHCSLLMHDEPGGKHDPAPQRLFMQTFEQQSSGVLHGNPSSAH